MTKPSDDTAPERPAKTVPANTTDAPEDTAPPTVPSSPSADTRGGAGTSTAEGPSRPKSAVPSPEEGEGHVKRDAKSDGEVDAPGARVDDEHEGRRDKKMIRQE